MIVDAAKRDHKVAEKESRSASRRAQEKKHRTGREDREIVIEPTHGWVSLRLGDLWEYRELIYFLMLRDIKVQYKQTILGVTWAVIQPFFSMVVFTLFFGKLAGVPSDGVPYELFSFAGLVPWYFFSNGLTLASNSLVGGSNLIKKVYFPRMTMPVAAVLSRGLDFAISFGMLLIVMAYFRVAPTWQILWLPLFLLLAVVTALGVSLWLSAMNVKFRDIRHTLTFITQLWLFATPVTYPSSLITEPWQRILYGLNPMVGVVEGFRWAVAGTNTAPGGMVAASSVVALLLLISGAFYFRRVEKVFADVV
jgi:lipopolysaccharide transport system permease protein